MSTSNGSDSEDFEVVLSEVVYGAFREGIEVKGGWDISAGNSEDVPDFTVEIYRVKR